MTQRDDQRRNFGPAGQRRRTELMEAAVLLAARQGFAKTRVSDIVGRVGVGQGVFYWYFDSKDALFQEVLRDTTLRLRLFQGACIQGEPDPVRRIAKGILATLDFVVHNRHAFALLDHAAMEARWQTQRSESGRVHVVDIVGHLREAIAAGKARDTDPEDLARGIAGVVDRMARAYFTSRDPDLDRLAQEAIDFCIGGLSGPRTIEVADLRAEIELGPELLDVRDRVGAATRDGEFEGAVAARRGRR